MIIRLMWHTITMGSRWRGAAQGQGTTVAGRVRTAAGKAVVMDDGREIEQPEIDTDDVAMARVRDTSRLAMNWEPLPPLDLPDHLFRWLGVELSEEKPVAQARPRTETKPLRQRAAKTAPLFLPR